MATLRFYPYFNSACFLYPGSPLTFAELWAGAQMEAHTLCVREAENYYPSQLLDNAVLSHSDKPL